MQLRGYNFTLLTPTLADGCHVSSAAVSLQDARTELLNWDLFLISSDPILHPLALDIVGYFQGGKTGLKRMGSCDKLRFT